jgi:hypothetical protein
MNEGRRIVEWTVAHAAAAATFRNSRASPSDRFRTFRRIFFINESRNEVSGGLYLNSDLFFFPIIAKVSELLNAISN